MLLIEEIAISCNPVLDYESQSRRVIRRYCMRYKPFMAIQVNHFLVIMGLIKYFSNVRVKATLPAILAPPARERRSQ